MIFRALVLAAFLIVDFHNLPCTSICISYDYPAPICKYGPTPALEEIPLLCIQLERLSIPVNGETIAINR